MYLLSQDRATIDSTGGLHGGIDRPAALCQVGVVTVNALLWVKQAGRYSLLHECPASFSRRRQQYVRITGRSNEGGCVVRLNVVTMMA